MYDTLIFDLDGTLLYTLEDIHDAVNHVLGKNGYSLNTLEDTRHYVGNGLKQLMKRSLPEDAGQEVLDRLAEELCDYYADHCQIKTRPYDGILECLEKLKSQGYKMAIVSNKIDEAVKELNALYFGKYISVAIGEREGIQRKPAPDTVYQALKELGASPEKALYIGDSEVDFATSQNAGLDCMSVSWGFRERSLLEDLKPAFLIDEPGEILETLEKLKNENGGK
ncbi:MAG: HAD family hydrolase [Lachnospiraceae bacterium]